MITIFFYIFLWMIVTLATNKNSFKKEKAQLSFALLCFALLGR